MNMYLFQFAQRCWDVYLKKKKKRKIYSGSSAHLFFASQICEEIGVKAPVNVKMFTGKGRLQHQVHIEPSCKGN